MSLQKPLRCAIYTRKSSEEGLEQDFNSLDAQREACEAYIKSQQHEGWVMLGEKYDDGGYSGGNVNRPALSRLMADIQSRKIDIVVVYKVDRLSRSLADFSRMVDTFDESDVSFVSITQQFNTSTSMGRLTLNVLLSFAQFEREVTGERIRDKIAASKKKGLWMGGNRPLGYDSIDRALNENPSESKIVQKIFSRYLVLQSVKQLKEELDRQGTHGRSSKPFSRGALYTILKNHVYIGKIRHKDKTYPGNHRPIIDEQQWHQVQRVLVRNRHHKYLRTEAKSPALLAGLLFDPFDHPFSPTHTRKQSRRYRYYVNQAKVQFKQTHPEWLLRVPAPELERVVTMETRRLLGDRPKLLKALQPLGLTGPELTASIEQAGRLNLEWPDLEPARHIEIFEQVISRIVLSRDTMCIRFNRGGIATLLLPESKGSLRSSETRDHYSVSIPMKLNRCGVETKLIIEEPADHSTLKPHRDSLVAIQNAVRKGILWNASLLSGEVSGIAELARQNNVSSRYISQIIKFAFLDPALVMRIFRGDIPHDLTLGKLKADLESDWTKQQALFQPAQPS